MSWFEKFKDAAEVLSLVRRPTLTLTQAQERYDPMVVAIAQALTTELGVDWTVDNEAEFEPFGRRWEYTTTRLICTRRLDTFPDWSARYEAVVHSIAAVTRLGTLAADPKRSPADLHPLPPMNGGFPTDDPEQEFVIIGPDDFGPSRLTRDAVGGNIDLDIDSDGTTLSISAAIAAPR